MRQTKGFTLFEILIAISIGVLLLGLVLSIYSLTVRALSTSQTRAELTQNSKIITERLTRDLRQTRQIATPLPAAGEIEMRDGHNTDIIQYIRYYRVGPDLKRQIREYYFPAEPAVLVAFNAFDDLGNPASVRIIADELIGQFVSSLAFSGENLITVQLQLSKNGLTQATATEIYGRNL